MPSKKRSQGRLSSRKARKAILSSEALRLREQGFTFQEIADQLGKSVSHAYELVEFGLSLTVMEPAENLRKLELLRLDRIQSAHFCKALDGDCKSTEAVLKINQRRAKMLGLDELAKQYHANRDTYWIEQLKAASITL